MSQKRSVGTFTTKAKRGLSLELVLGPQPVASIMAQNRLSGSARRRVRISGWTIRAFTMRPRKRGVKRLAILMAVRVASIYIPPTGGVRCRGVLQCGAASQLVRTHQDINNLAKETIANKSSIAKKPAPPYLGGQAYALSMNRATGSAELS